VNFEPNQKLQAIIDAFRFAYNSEQLFVNFGKYKETGDVTAFLSYIEEREDGKYFVPLGKLFEDNMAVFEEYDFDFQELDDEEETEFSFPLDSGEDAAYNEEVKSEKNLLQRVIAKFKG
jgi:hypothetical protein